jgi:hypothetical protein
MMTRFASVDDLLKSIKETKFPFVGLPYSFGAAFPGVVKIVKDGDSEYWEIRGEKFLVIKHVPEMLMDIIQVMGN